MQYPQISTPVRVAQTAQDREVGVLALFFRAKLSTHAKYL